MYSGYRLSFLGVKRLGRGANHPSPSSAEVKERVELYLCFHSRSSRPVLGGTLHLDFEVVSVSFAKNIYIYIDLTFSVQVMIQQLDYPHLVVVKEVVSLSVLKMGGGLSQRSSVLCVLVLVIS